MADNIEILTIAQKEQWLVAHRDAGLPSQSWHYAWALSAMGIEPKLAVVDSGGARMLLPFYEREWRGSTDIATILGTSGASISSNSVAPLRLWREYAAAQGWVAGYIQLSTLVDLHGRLPESELVDINEWFELDLRRDDIISSFSEILRRKIRRGARDASLAMADRALLSENLRRLFPVAMKRVGARPHYSFPEQTLDRWVMSPDSLVLGASVNGGIEAVSVFLVAGEHAEYHLIGSSDRGRDLAAWLIWNAIVILKERGVNTLHLGGGVRRGDGLHEFKQKFGTTPKLLQAVRQIYDQVRYDELCLAARVSPSGGAWFPVYRAR